jgi:hypothetical protein
MPSLKRYAVVALIAASGAFACRTAAPPAPPATASVPAGIAWLVLVDDLHLDFRSTGYLRAFLKRIAGELIQEGDSFALRSTGPSSLAIGLTSDRTVLEGAIRKTSGAGLLPIDILDNPRPGEIPSEVVYRADVALTTAREVVESVAPASRERRAFIYISNGYNFDLSSDARSESRVVRRTAGRDVSVPRVREQVSALIRRAKESRIRIFAIDPRGLAPAALSHGRMDAAAWRDYLAITRRSLLFIAERTGGFTEYEDLPGSLKRIRAAMR